MTDRTLRRFARNHNSLTSLNRAGLESCDGYHTLSGAATPPWILSLEESLDLRWTVLHSAASHGAALWKDFRQL